MASALAALSGAAAHAARIQTCDVAIDHDNSDVVDPRHPPGAAGSGLVGLGVWLWTTATSETWGPNSITAAVPGLAVTATARVGRFSVAMGDGHTVSCTVAGAVVDASPSVAASPGTPYLQ